MADRLPQFEMEFFFAIRIMASRGDRMLRKFLAGPARRCATLSLPC